MSGRTMGRPATRRNAAPTTASSRIMARPRFAVWLMAAMLVLVTMALYWPATRFDFINFDDPGFVTSNLHVQGGLNWEAVKWAFQLNKGDYWHPLTWLSLMLDVSLFGPGAGGFHFTNVAFHAANGVLLFLWLRMLTGAFWRSAMVAALFALHPLRVESVAWVTERKDVLSGCCGLLALICYTRYAAKRVTSNKWSVTSDQTSGTPATGNAPRIHLLSSVFYLLSLFFFACGLMSKAMLVTWPFVMLLLDYWPLQRLQLFPVRLAVPSLRPLVREKIPFFVLSGISCVLTYLTERGRPEVAGFEEAPALLRLENAFVAYARYLGKTFWPARLAVPYMNPGHWPWLEVMGSVVVVAGACVVFLWLGRRWPYLLVGWYWFWGTLIPVIGLTKGWGSFMGDRFTYVPSIGVLILTVWGVWELTRDWRHQVMALSVVGSAAIVLCLALTRQQLGHWQDSEALFRHALEVTENNHIAHNNLGMALLGKARTDEAIRQFQEAIRLKPDLAKVHDNLGNALVSKGQADEAIRQYQEAIRLKPDLAKVHNNLGNALVSKGQADEAIRQYQEAIRLKPDLAEAHNSFGIALFIKGQIDEAIRQYQEAIRLKPDYALAHNDLGFVLAEKGQIDEAIRQYQEAIRLKPEYAKAHNNLGNALVSKGQADEAIGQFREALRLKPDFAEARKNLERAVGTRAVSTQPPGILTNR
jgi:tetratricopeptide (TPR) repeat protein